MSGDDWQDGGLFAVGMRHHQEACADLLVLVNGGDACTFTLPEDGKWQLILDTSREDVACAETVEAQFTVETQSVAVLKDLSADV